MRTEPTFAEVEAAMAAGRKVMLQDGGWNLFLVRGIRAKDGQLEVSSLITVPPLWHPCELYNLVISQES
jgi:hypothetical protein